MKSEILEIITENAGQTQKVGRFLAEEIIKGKLKSKKALVIGLKGELGSGKTTFIQGLAKGFGIKERITSPTFVIMKRHSIKNRGLSQLLGFYHIDCYRINHSQELINLDFKEMINNPQNVIAIEWAERIRKILPVQNILWINFKHLDQKQRKIILKLSS
jgi:tRNA threonylcarbamoyladenosine biosynthesis protein TsaE